MKMTKAERMRRLFDQGLTVSQIAQVMDVRYQHAYNVISEYKRDIRRAGDRNVVRYPFGTSSNVGSHKTHR